MGTLKPEADLGADKPIAAQKDNLKIAVEVKSFIHSRGYQKPGFLSGREAMHAGDGLMMGGWQWK